MGNNCIACGNVKFYLKYRKVADYEYGTYHPVDFNICNKCGLIRQNPLPEQKFIPSFYPEAYRNHLKSSDGFFYSKLKHFQLWWFARKIEKFLSTKNAEILEIGCGNGALLNALKSKGYKKLWGSDLLDVSKETLQRSGIQFKKGDAVKSFPFIKRFDLIILNHVFEHLSSPNTVLTDCRKHLSKQGKVIIVMPNGDSLAAFIFKEKWDGLNAPRHFFIFSPKSMDKLKKQTGFNHIGFHPMPDPLSWSISLQNVFQDIPLFSTRLKNGLAWYTIFCGILFIPIAVLSMIGNKSAGVLYELS